MMSEKPLSLAVQERLLNEGNSLFTPEALDALRLSDVFESVRAQEYVLPLDAMAGFPRQTPADTDGGVPVFSKSSFYTP